MLLAIKTLKRCLRVSIRLFVIVEQSFIVSQIVGPRLSLFSEMSLEVPLEHGTICTMQRFE